MISRAINQTRGIADERPEKRVTCREIYGIILTWKLSSDFPLPMRSIPFLMSGFLLRKSPMLSPVIDFLLLALPNSHFFVSVRGPVRGPVPVFLLDSVLERFLPIPTDDV